MNAHPYRRKRLHLQGIRKIGPGADAEIADLFTEMGKVTGLPVADLAAQLDTTPEMIMALEAGDMAALPDWRQTSSTITAYARLLNLDEQPILRRVALNIAPADQTGGDATGNPYDPPPAEAQPVAPEMNSHPVAAEFGNGQAGLYAATDVRPGRMTVNPAVDQPHAYRAAPQPALPAAEFPAPDQYAPPQQPVRPQEQYTQSPPPRRTSLADRLKNLNPFEKDTGGRGSPEMTDAVYNANAPHYQPAGAYQAGDQTGHAAMPHVQYNDYIPGEAPYSEVPQLTVDPEYAQAGADKATRRRFGAGRLFGWLFVLTALTSAGYLVWTVNAKPHLVKAVVRNLPDPAPKYINRAWKFIKPLDKGR